MYYNQHIEVETKSEFSRRHFEIYFPEQKYINFDWDLAEVCSQGSIEQLFQNWSSRPGGKPLFEPLMVSLPTHTCVTRPHWIKARYIPHGDSLKYSYMIEWNQFGICLWLNDETLTHVVENKYNICKIFVFGHPELHSRPVFIGEVLKCEIIFIYAICRLMYRIYHGELCILD